MDRRKFVKSSLLASGVLATMPAFTIKTKMESLPKVVLLGDSIRMGYKPFVEEELEGVAEVWVPEDNCRTTDNIIYFLNDYIKKPKPDLVHINAGLHDIRTLNYDSKPGETIVKSAHYRDNLETIFSWIQNNVGCKIIWATTTPVVEARIKSRNANFMRYNSDIEKINKIAKKVAGKYNIPVNDLYQFVREQIGDDGIKKDGVHFPEESNKILGKHVAGFIQKQLIQSEL